MRWCAPLILIGAAFVVDGTLGLGGHSEMLLERYPQMRILGLDWDADALGIARERLETFGDRFEGDRRQAMRSCRRFCPMGAVGQSTGSCWI